MATGIEEAGLDRTFLNVSSWLAEPLCQVYGLLRYRLVAPLDPQKFSNSDSKAAEIAKRALILVAAIASLSFFPLPLLLTAVGLGLGSKVFRAIGFALQKGGYTHIRGQAPEKRLEPGQAKIMTWNLCGIGGGMHFDHGGVNHWRSRIDSIVRKIKEEDPDVLLLQEIYDTAFVEALVEKLSPDYAHFFAHLGANVWGSVGGGMVICKCAVSRFTNTSFNNNDWTLNRTFAVLDIKTAPEEQQPAARIIGTHFIHNDNQKRLEQLAQVVNSVARETIAVPTVLAGDLNMERDRPDQGGQLSRYLIHAYQGDEPTATNELVRQWEGKAQAVPDETIDYISLFRDVAQQGVQMRDTHLVRAFDATYNTKKALSDHHGLATTLTFG